MEDASPRGDAVCARPSADRVRLYLSRLFLPLESEVLVADVSAENLAWLSAHLGPCALRPVSREELLAAVRARHGAALLDNAVFGLRPFRVALLIEFLRRLRYWATHRLVCLPVKVWRTKIGMAK